MNAPIALYHSLESNRRPRFHGPVHTGFFKWVKSIRLIVLAAALLLVSTGIVGARLVPVWSYQELLDKSDLVVLATAIDTKDTKEQIDLPGFVGERVIGVNTKFAVSAVLKGDRSQTNIFLHHYRTSDGTNIPHVPNGPSFVSFAPAENATLFSRAYILFLVREADGRYAPVVGQTDPGSGVKELVSAAR
ncbi:MAG: hypothetical protein ACREIC_06470 [Limisphaerales bacterium]